ncbi:hypothetical protein N0V90_004461 [Kalmusia sp. IMI 367209]|nr:hypothetical protein N0V90_004461 [Kalmusia sp. IMI 367209]
MGKDLALTKTREVHIETDEDGELLFPNGGWDVHHHIFEPARFVYAPDRHLTPPAATIEQFLNFKARLGLTHSVLTHGLSYGDDCTSLRTFIPELGKQSTFGVGVINPKTVTPTVLQDMHSAGVRGVRINLYHYGAMHDVELQKRALREHAAVLKKHCPGWSIAFTHIHPEFWGDLIPIVEELAAAGIPLVTDHFGLLKASSMLSEEHASQPIFQPGFSDIISLVRSGALYVKLSAPYRISERAPHYDDIRPLVLALVHANPNRILWGSDWPHTPRMEVRSKEAALKETPFLVVDDRAWLQSLKAWVGDEVWDLVMVRNPKELYGNK